MELLSAFLDKLLALLPLVVVAAPIIAFFIDLGKRVGLPDGLAPILSGVLNAGVLVVLFVFGDQGVIVIKKVNDLIVVVGPAVTIWVLSVLASPKFHELLKGAGLGFSHPVEGNG